MRNRPQKHTQQQRSFKRPIDIDQANRRAAAEKLYTPLSADAALL